MGSRRVGAKDGEAAARRSRAASAALVRGADAACAAYMAGYDAVPALVFTADAVTEALRVALALVDGQGRPSVRTGGATAEPAAKCA